MPDYSIEARSLDLPGPYTEARAQSQMQEQASQSQSQSQGGPTLAIGARTT